MKTSLLLRTPIYRPAWPRPAGLLAFSDPCSGGGRGGEGDITRERGPLRRPLWSWFLVSVLLGPRSLPGPTSSPSPCSAASPYWLGLLLHPGL